MRHGLSDQTWHLCHAGERDHRAGGSSFARPGAVCVRLAHDGRQLGAARRHHPQAAPDARDALRGGGGGRGHRHCGGGDRAPRDAHQPYRAPVDVKAARRAEVGGGAPCAAPRARPLQAPKVGERASQGSVASSMRSVEFRRERERERKRERDREDRDERERTERTQIGHREDTECGENRVFGLESVTLI
eukprot:1482694-Pyramimonas_sp.AAC.1